MSIRNQKRARERLERYAQKTGKWGDWMYSSLPNGAGSSGWARQFNRAMKNDRCAAMFRDVQHPVFGTVTHIMISTISGIEPTWQEKQRLKNELLGREYTAIEIMPPAGEVVDEADAYHIWGFVSDVGLSLFDHKERQNAAS